MPNIAIPTISALRVPPPRYPPTSSTSRRFARLSAPPAPAHCNVVPTERPSAVHIGWMRIVSLAFAHRGRIDIYRDERRHLSALLRLRAPPHGLERLPMASPRAGRAGPIPHGAIMGTRPAAVFPARRAHFQLDSGDSSSRLFVRFRRAAWIGQSKLYVGGAGCRQAVL